MASKSKKRRCNNHDAPSNNLTKIKQTNNKECCNQLRLFIAILSKKFLFTDYSTNIKMFNKKTKQLNKIFLLCHHVSCHSLVSYLVL